MRFKSKNLVIMLTVMLCILFVGCSKKEADSKEGEAIKGEVIAENQADQEEKDQEEKTEESTEKPAEEPAEEQSQEILEETAVNEKTDTNSETHYENEYFAVDVPESWIGNWSISETENTMQADNPRVIAAYTASYNDIVYGGGGGAIIHVLKIEEGDRLGYGYFSMSPDVEYVDKDASSEFFTFIMTQAGAGFFKEGGATITAK